MRVTRSQTATTARRIGLAKFGKPHEYVHTKKFYRGVRDEYVSICLLGSGAYANVFKAMNMRTGEYAALKIFNCLGQERADFELEWEVMRELESIGYPWMIPFLDVSSGGPDFFIVYEMMDGCVGKDTMFDLETTFRAAEELLEALSFLHFRGIGHGDICTENILFKHDQRRGRDHSFRFSDFGLSGNHENSSRSRECVLVGHVQFTDNALVEDEGEFTPFEAQKLCDIHALGTTLIHMMNSRDYHAGYINFPIETSNGERDCRRQLDDDPRLFSHLHDLAAAMTGPVEERPIAQTALVRLRLFSPE